MKKNLQLFCGLVICVFAIAIAIKTKIPIVAIPFMLCACVCFYFLIKPEPQTKPKRNSAQNITITGKSNDIVFVPIDLEQTLWACSLVNHHYQQTKIKKQTYQRNEESGAITFVTDYTGDVLMQRDGNDTIITLEQFTIETDELTQIIAQIILMKYNIFNLETIIKIIYNVQNGNKFANRLNKWSNAAHSNSLSPTLSDRGGGDEIGETLQRYSEKLQ